jgi:hypothetical protein
MVVALWIFVGLFWVGVVAKHYWMKDETRAERTLDWDYPIMDRLGRILDWVLAPLIRRARKKRQATAMSDAQRNADIIASFLALHDVRHHVEWDDEGKVTCFVHKEDGDKLQGILSDLEQEFGPLVRFNRVS